MSVYNNIKTGFTTLGNRFESTAIRDASGAGAQSGINGMVTETGDGVAQGQANTSATTNQLVDGLQAATTDSVNKMNAQEQANEAIDAIDERNKTAKSGADKADGEA